MNSRTNSDLKKQIEDLQTRLRETEGNLDAIRSGKADAIVVQTEDGVKVFTIQGAETAYRIMVDNMNEGALTVDPEGVILYANTRFCSMMGVPTTYLPGKHIQEIVGEEFREEFDIFLRKTVSGGTVHQDFVFVRRDQSSFPVYLSSAPLEIAVRHDACIIVSDLTERKLHQEKLVKLNNELEFKVKTRTHELEEQKTALEQSQEQLRKLTMSLEDQVIRRTAQVRDLAKALTLAEQKERQRLSRILHEDLQQVLFSIKARFELLNDVLSDRTGEINEDIRELDRLTTKALDTSKMLAIEFNPPILRNEGLDAALKWLAHHMEQRYGLKVDICILEGFGVIRDEERVLLVQIIRELLFNVVKHAGTKEASVTVTRKEDRLDVIVEDRGTGFNVEDVKKITQDGTRMGLFSIEQRLRLFGGYTHIQSKQGEGTRIILSLPFDRSGQRLGVE